MREIDGQVVKPKIVASTATARRAHDQIHALFARGLTQVSPARAESPRHVLRPDGAVAGDAGVAVRGIASQGRNPKILMGRILLALRGAEQQAWHKAGARGAHGTPPTPP